MKEKIAIPLEGTQRVVLLGNGERMTREKALQAGYRIVDANSLTPVDTDHAAANAFDMWRSRVSCLPEACERPSALAEIIASQTHATMSVEQARAFLRGLPTEQRQDNESVSTENQDPRAARQAEITESMRLFNKDRGFATKPKPAPSLASIEPTRLRRLAEIRLAALNANAAYSTERKNLAYALSVHDQTGAPLTNVFVQLGVDTSKIIPNV